MSWYRGGNRSKIDEDYQKKFDPGNSNGNGGSNSNNNSASEFLSGAEKSGSYAPDGAATKVTNGITATSSLSDASAPNTFKYNHNAKDGDSNKTTSKKKGGIGGFMKKTAPAALIGAVIAAIWGGMTISQSFMPFSLAALIKGERDTINTSTMTRSGVFLRMQLDNGRVKNCVKTTIFGSNKFKLSKRQIAKLSQSGIDYDPDTKTMSFIDADGTRKLVTADNFQNTFDTNETFRKNYTEGSKTWRGAIASWFDDKATKVLSYFGIKRDKYHDKVTGDAAQDDAKFKDNIEGQAEDKGSAIKAKGDGEDEKPEDGGDDPDTSDADDDVAKLSLNESDAADTATLSKKLNDFGNKYKKATGKVSAAANYACSLASVLSAIGAAVAAMQTVEVVKTAAAFLEVPDKAASAVSPETSPINSMAATLIKPGNVKRIDKDGNEVEVKGSAMEAASVRSLYDGQPANMDDPSLRGFNFSTMLSSVSGNMALLEQGINLSMSSFKSCLYAKLAASAVDAFGDLFTMTACFAGDLAQCVKPIVEGFVTSLALSSAIALVVTAIIPTVAQSIGRNVLKDAVGEDLGNAIVDGGYTIMSENHKQGGGAFLDETGYRNNLALQAENDRIIAQYERETLSPFDLSSKNTFLGSIMTKLIPITTKTGSILGRFNALSNTVTKSIASLMPAASAADSSIKASAAKERTEKYCPYIDSVGAVADEFCNPIVGTDTTTLKLDPADVVNTVAELDERNLDETVAVSSNGGVYLADSEEPDYNAPIEEDSRLGKFLEFCWLKQSPLGMPDQNVIAEVDPTDTGNSTVNAAIGAIPFVGDAFDAVSNGRQLQWYGYISGEACVMNNNAGSERVDGVKIEDDEGGVGTLETENGSSKNTVPSWQEAKYYQRYAEDQRLAESMGLIDKSAVSVFIEDYLEKHPLDNSYEGVIARRSGLRKDQVIAVLNILDYNNFLATYDPSDSYPLTHDAKEKQYIFEEDVLPEVYIIASGDYILPKRHQATIG